MERAQDQALIVQKLLPRDQNQTMPLTKVSVETAPRDSHMLITQWRKRGKKCCDFKSKVRTPKHLNIPHTGRRDAQYF